MAVSHLSVSIMDKAEYKSSSEKGVPWSRVTHEKKSLPVGRPFRRVLSNHPMRGDPMTVGPPMAPDPYRMVSSWTGRAGMDHGGTRSERKEDKNENCCFDQA